MTSQQKQHIGDALFTFLAREYYHDKYPAHGKFDHSKINVLVGRMSSNGMMGLIAVRLGIITQAEAHIERKSGGDALEQFIFETYAKEGFAYIQQWFAEQVVPAFTEVNGIVGFSEV